MQNDSKHPIQVADQDSEQRVCVATGLKHCYPGSEERPALAGVDLSTKPGEIAALLGPNGSGKTTLFRLLCTLMPIQQGTITVDGIDSATDPLGIRSKIGIVFQSPSLDKNLTVDENIACQAALYGIAGKRLTERRDELLEQLELVDRRSTMCGKLSGGLKRRVELAKGMLHHPKLLLLDEPSTGLDPAARLSLWSTLRAMAESGMSILMTTHLLEEADKADRVAILAGGKKIAEGSPHQLRSELGAGVVTVETSKPDAVAEIVQRELNLDVSRTEHQLRISNDSPAELVPLLAKTFEAANLDGAIQSIIVGRPGLEDVFIAKTGQRFS